VIGAALAASTAVDGQCYKSNGLSGLDMNKGPDRRDGLFCAHPKGIPAELAPLKGKLGKTVFVDPYDGESCFLTSSPGVFAWYNKNCGRGGGGGLRRRAVPSSAGVRRWGEVGWKTYAKQKQRLMGAIMRPHEEKSTHCLEGHDHPMRCVIF